MTATALRPFFCYLGGKWCLSRGWGGARYPAPAHGRIVEPFAGAAGYSTVYHDRSITLYDTDPVVAGIWRYLIRSTAVDILRLPLQVECTDDLHCCDEAKWLIGFWLNKGSGRPAKRPSPRMVKPSWQHRPASHWGPEIRDRIASQVDRIKHWKFHEKSWERSIDFDWGETLPMTWFVDPPYRVAGTAYRNGSSGIDYAALATFVRSRTGQVIVCENEGADWLPFVSFRASKSTHRGGKNVSMEVLYVAARRGPRGVR